MKLRTFINILLKLSLIGLGLEFVIENHSVLWSLAGIGLIILGLVTRIAIQYNNKII